MHTKTEMKTLLGDLLVESSIDAMIALDPDNTVIAWNRAATILFERQKSEALGKILTDVLPSVHDDYDFIKAINLAKEGIQSFVPSSKLLPHRLHVETHVIPLKSEGEPSGVMLLVHDVAHRVLKELQLQYLNSELQNRLRQLSITNRELAYLTQIATHNIKEPIRSIYTTIERLIETEARTMSDTGKASFRRIQSSLNRMNLLLDDVITLTQINVVDKPYSHVNLEKILPDIITQLQPRIRETGAIIKSGELCEITAHKSQVQLLLYHILNNAIRFNNTGEPLITISCRKIFVDEDKPAIGNPGEYFELAIVHNGYGFHNTDLESIFNAFEKGRDNNYLGPGIASIVTAKIMEVHEGFLQVEKDGDSHTHIKCYFPADAKTREEPHPFQQ